MGWLKRFLVWLVLRAWPLWVTVVFGFGPMFSFPVFWTKPEECFNTYGISLQLFGVVLVAKGFYDTTARFSSGTTIASRIGAWLRSAPVPFGKKAQAIHPDFIASGESFGTPTMTMSVKEHGGTELERRIYALERNFTEMRKGLNEDMGAIRKELAKLDTALKEEGQQRAMADAATEKKLREQFADGVTEGYLGLATLFFGTVYSGMPKFLSTWCYVRWLQGH